MQVVKQFFFLKKILLVRVYLSTHPFVDLESILHSLFACFLCAHLCYFGASYMAQQGKKTLNMFRNLRNKLVEEAKKSGEPAVPNLKGALVDVRAPSGEKKEGCGAYPERGRK